MDSQLILCVDKIDQISRDREHNGLEWVPPFLFMKETAVKLSQYRRKCLLDNLGRKYSIPSLIASSSSMLMCNDWSTGQMPEVDSPVERTAPQPVVLASVDIVRSCLGDRMFVPGRTNSHEDHQFKSWMEAVSKCISESHGRLVLT